MVMRDIMHELQQLGQIIDKAIAANTPLSGEDLECSINTIVDGLAFRNPRANRYALGLLANGLFNSVFRDADNENYRTLLTSAKETAASTRDPELMEWAAKCYSVLSSQMQQDSGTAFPTLDGLISKALKEGYKTDYKPNIFYATNRDEFWEKIEEHNKKQRGGEEPVNHDDIVTRVSFYSDVLKECIVYPGISQFFEEQRDNPLHQFTRLKYFEDVFHEVTHGLIDSVQGDEEILDVHLLGEYATSLTAHQITVDHADEITGKQITQDLYDTFVERNRVTSLTPRQEERKMMGVSREGMETTEQIARYFIPKLNSRTGLRQIKNVF